MSGAPGAAATARVHGAAGLAGVQPVPPRPQQQRRTGVRRRQRGAAPGQPGVERLLGRHAVGHAALLAALAEHPQQPAPAVDVVDVEADELADPDAAGVEQLEDDGVAQPDRLLGAAPADSTTARAWSGASTSGSVRCAFGLTSRSPTSSGVRPARRSQAVNDRADAACRAVVARLCPRVRPCASQLRRAARSRSCDLRAAPPDEVVEQPDRVGDVAADGVLGQVALGAQVLLVPGQRLRQRRRQRRPCVSGPGGHPRNRAAARPARQAAAPGPSCGCRTAANSVEPAPRLDLVRLTFRRMADRRPVETLVERDDGVVFTMRGAGGGSDLPHDLVHAVVEQQLGVADGIWGCVADGVVWRSMTHLSGRQPPHAADRSRAGSSANAPTSIQRAEALADLVGRLASRRGGPARRDLGRSGIPPRLWPPRRRAPGRAAPLGRPGGRRTSGWSSGRRRPDARAPPARPGGQAGTAAALRPAPRPLLRAAGASRQPVPVHCDEVGELQRGQHPQHLEDVAAGDRGQPLRAHPGAHRAGVEHPGGQVGQPVPRARRPLRRGRRGRCRCRRPPRSRAPPRRPAWRRPPRRAAARGSRPTSPR